MATIRDVARHAGVAPSTVSYALSGKRSISDDVRARIDAAIVELNFTPSALGRQLAQSRSNMIGLAFPVSKAELHYEVLDFIPSAAATLHEHGYGLSVFTHPLSAQQVLKLYRENKIDGMILMQIMRHDERVEVLRNTGFPLVLIGRCADTAGLTLVEYDTAEACYLVFEHLVKLGHTRIGYLDLPHSRRQLGYAWQIQQGYERACRTLHIAPVREEIDGGIETGYRATLAMLRRDPHLTAIVTVHADTAIGVTRALRQSGRRVPEHVSLAGVNREGWFRAMSPQMTSSDVPLVEMVRTGAEMLIHQLTHPATTQPQEIILPARLIIRESTAPRNEELRFLFDPR